ncbi:MAG: MoaD/ThiS family protein [Gemmatimonadales bacterium]
MSSISVQLFARYADLLGASRLEVPSARADSIAEVVCYLRSLPGGDALPERPFVAVNHAQVGEDYRPQPGDEIALLPPMAGG